MSGQEFKVYALQFSHEGREWAFELPARNFTDLKARLRELRQAEILGVLEADIPEDHPVFSLTSLYDETRTSLVRLLKMLRTRLDRSQPSAREVDSFDPGSGELASAPQGEMDSWDADSAVGTRGKRRFRIIGALQKDDFFPGKRPTQDQLRTRRFFAQHVQSESKAVEIDAEEHRRVMQ